MAASTKQQDNWHFGGYVREMFNDSATIEIHDCPVVDKGKIVTVAKADFAEQSFRTGVGPGSWVEGRVFAEPNSVETKFRFRYITRII